MSFRATTLKRNLGLSLFLSLLPVALFAQTGGKSFPITFANSNAVVVSRVTPPSFGSANGSSSTSDANQWLKVEFHYSVVPPVGAKYLDSATFKLWIEGRDLLAKNAATREGVAVALTGTVTYVNIPEGKDQYGVMYVHPSTLGRYSSTQGPSDFDRKFNIHIEASSGGAYSDNQDKREEKDKRWFTTLTVVPNMVFRQDQSPFITTDTDRYPAQKLSPTPGEDASTGGSPAAPAGAPPADPASTPAPAAP